MTNISLLLSPHSDDESLFAAFTCIREKPIVMVCFGSFIQPARGEVGCSEDERFAETQRACEILGCSATRTGIRDDISDYLQAMVAIKSAFDDWDHMMKPDVVYAPALQGGHWQHYMVGNLAKIVFGSRVKLYTTYTKAELYTTGDIEIVPTPEELELKNRALACYTSQLRINGPHFEAVRGRSEWLMR